jgi:AraC family transcriptional regulator of adaptative response / DNA-3-methyladenine glycosylase II
VEFLAMRAVPGVEEVADGVYRRSLRLAHGAGVVALRPGAGMVAVGPGAGMVAVGPGAGMVALRPGAGMVAVAPGAGEVALRPGRGARGGQGRGMVDGEVWLADPRDLAAAEAACRRLLDLDTDPAPIREALSGDELIGPLVRAAPGRRVPGHVDSNELAIRAVLGQQVSLAGAATLAARLVRAYGEPLPQAVGSVTHLFPTVTALAGADDEALAMPAARRRAVLGLAAALAGGEIVLDHGLADGEAERRLLALPGIGPWTTAYIAMRALGDPDAFMPTDLGVRHALELLGCDGRPPSATRIAERWRPYRAYGMQHLWAHLAAQHAPGRSHVARASSVRRES